MKILMSCLLFFLAQDCLSAEVFCDSGKPHPIELKLEKHLHDTALDNTTFSALEEAHDRWDAELNKAYKELMSSLKPEDQLALKQAQRAWLVYRDTQIELWSSEALYGGSGWLGRVAVQDLIRGLISQRTCELMRYKKMAYTGPGA